MKKFTRKSLYLLVAVLNYLAALAYIFSSKNEMGIPFIAIGSMMLIFYAQENGKK